MITYEQYRGFENPQEEIENAILRREEISGEVWQVVHDNFDIIATESDMDDAGRWTVPEDIIFKLDNRFFCIWFNRGLTEYQENEWEDQVAVEVRPKQITITTWEAVENE